MDTPAEITILCTYCGHLLATQLPGVINVKGQALSTEHLDGVILKCVCKRTKTYYLREQKPSKNGHKMNIQDIV